MRKFLFFLLILWFFSAPLQAATGSLFSDGEVKIHYEHFPAVSPERGSLLLIHGLGGSTFSWRKISPELADAGFNVYAVDLPGFGQSPGGEKLDLSRAGFAEILWDFWLAQSPIQPWHFLGHSMGGGIALQMLDGRRGNVDGLVLIAPAIQERGAGFWVHIFRIRAFRRIGGWIMGNFFLTEKRVEEILSSAYGRKPTSEEFDEYYKPLAKPGALENLFKMTADNLINKKELPSPIKERVLLIWGEEDSWVPPPQKDDDINLFLDYELKIVPGGGHLVMETHWEETLNLIFEYLGGKPHDSH